MDQARQHFAQSLFIWLGLVCLASAQSFPCTPLTINDLGSTTSFSANGLISPALEPSGERTNEIPVRIIDYHIVCDASGNRRNTSFYVSVLVQFQCMFSISGGFNNLPTCDGSTIVTRQYQFQCVENNRWDTYRIWYRSLGSDSQSNCYVLHTTG